MNKSSTTLYVHIPFCLKKCTYCNFNSITIEKDLCHQYLFALKKEIRSTTVSDRKSTINSVFFGGGTPSILPPKTFRELLETIDTTFNRSDPCEITVEANPGTISFDYCRGLLSAGVNRLSIGIQSFDNQLLKLIGRIHNQKQAIEAVDNARSAGFKNISIDLMFGLPGQSVSAWKNELDVAASLGPDHISAYGLTPEPDTPLENQLQAKEFTLPDDNAQKHMYNTTISSLKNLGYTHYEISNFSIQGKECIHNLNYWDNGEYAGFGAGAFSFSNNVRKENESDIHKYSALVQEGISPVIFSESLSKERFMRETIILGLRKTEGVKKKNFEKRFGVAIMDVLKDKLPLLEEQGLLVSDNDSVYLTPKGILLSDSVFMEIV